MQYWSFFRQIHRWSPVALIKGQQSGQRYNQQELSAHFFFNILTTLDYFLQSKTT